MRCDVKVMLEDETGDRFMGVGLIWLLERVDRYRSISEAARDMHLSYPKALRMIRRLEGTLGREVVERWKGGHRRGGSRLTPFGRAFLDGYERMQERIKRFADATFREELGHLLDA
jgi:molybdate transport system regulatory protein